MGSLSDYAENMMLDHILGTTTYTPKATIYLAISTTNPDDAIGNLTEPVGGSYARVAIAFDAASVRKVVQTAVAEFPTATGDWGTISHYAIMEDITGGNMIAHGALVASRSVTSGKTFSITGGEIEISMLTGAWSDYLVHTSYDFVFRNQAFAQPTIYVALVETTEIVDADDGSTIDELEMTGYAREAHASWSASVAGATDNTGVIDFGTLTGTGEVITASCLTDNLTTGAGNVLMYDNALNQIIDDGDSVEYADGDFNISLS